MVTGKMLPDPQLKLLFKSMAEKYKYAIPRIEAEPGYGLVIL
jgi:hypothetical protein